MNKTEFREGIEKLELAYNQKFTSEKLKVWWDKLQEMKTEEFYKRLDELIEVKKFMPNVAEILNKADRLSDFEQRDYSDFDFTKLIKNRWE